MTMHARPTPPASAGRRLESRRLIAGPGAVHTALVGSPHSLYVHVEATRDHQGDARRLFAALLHRDELAALGRSLLELYGDLEALQPVAGAEPAVQHRAK